jgi:hypothetical protein
MLFSPITFLTGQGVGRFSFLQERRQTVPTPPLFTIFRGNSIAQNPFSYK